MVHIKKSEVPSQLSMLQANKGPLIAESSDNIPPLPLGQAILVLLTCEDDIFADALSRGTSTAGPYHFCSVRNRLFVSK